MTSGTGRGAALSDGTFTAGKTGTTSENFDRWFIGYSPYYVASVWYGYDTPASIEMSSNPCIPVWKNVMDKVHSTIKKKNRSIDIDYSVSVSSGVSKSKNTEDVYKRQVYHYLSDEVRYWARPEYTRHPLSLNLFELPNVFSVLHLRLTFPHF